MESSMRLPSVSTSAVRSLLFSLAIDYVTRACAAEIRLLDANACTPDITTPDALRNTLLAQQKVTYSDSSTGGLSGINAQKVLENLGIADEMKSKLLPHTDGQGLIAKGEADLGLYNVSEIPRAKGVVLLGPVPAAVQAYITYDAGVPASNASPSAAIEFLKFVVSPAAAPSWRAAGLELAGPPP